MNKIKLLKEDIYKGNLILINKEHKLKKKINKDSLEEYNEKYPNILLDKNANKYLQFILNEIKAQDKIIPVSGFRTNEEQKKIYEDSIKENGILFTKKFVAKPCSSEHEASLAIDLGIKKDVIDFIRPSFPHEGVCNDFRKLAVKYGFIERYTKDKECITNISEEEWHFRFVGIPHSEIINKYHFCLEEYIEYLKNNKINYKNYEIYYLPYKDNLVINLENIENISGNNIDGFIITKKNVEK